MIQRFYVRMNFRIIFQMITFMLSSPKLPGMHQITPINAKKIRIFIMMVRKDFYPLEMQIKD